MAGRQVQWVLEQPETSHDGQPRSLYNETGARRRRAHQKSRRGCTSCKQRRVKCDEKRPSCGQCSERETRCEFPSTSKPAKSPRNTPPSQMKRPVSPSPESNGLTEGSREWKHAQILLFMERSNAPRLQIGVQSDYQRQDALELMDHFEDFSEPWIGSHVAQRVTQENGVLMGLQASYLLHAILAYSASHLSHLYPEQKKYSDAAKLHYTRSLQAYSTQLVYELEKGSANANALLSASGLLAKLSFINTPLMSEDSDGVSAAVPPWIKSMQGVKTIMQTPKLRKQLEDGDLSAIVRHYIGPASKQPITVGLGRSQRSTSTVGALMELCGLQDRNCSPNVYSSAMDRLEPIMLSEPTHDDTEQYLGFIATLEPSFLELLERRDTRALLILAYWCTRVSLIKHWWTAPSAKAECRRICAHLSREKDARVQALLKGPADFCGFNLQQQSQLPSPPADSDSRD